MYYKLQYRVLSPFPLELYRILVNKTVYATTLFKIRQLIKINFWKNKVINLCRRKYFEKKSLQFAWISFSWNTNATAKAGVELKDPVFTAFLTLKSALQ